MAIPTVYDPTRVSVIWGALAIKGYAPGRFITMRRDDPVWTTVVGTNGEFKRTRQRNKSGTVELTLRSTHAVNRALGILLKADESSGLMIAPLVIIESLNGALVATTDAWLERYPEMSYGTDEGDTVWRWRCNEIDMGYSGLSVETLKRNELLAQTLSLEFAG